ncbi:MAG: electron transport complex subunit RsxG [Pseudomonadales bacterium]|nr:electron transport complex subunit RsxG [Pseudomonadales bacterium]MCP5214687.1 electron transport complex subunit RsxG [Pseudomonadales bacterium]MCP5303131.1 electron transport complex subunit RsxG [Pseudomonadales bacterium]
MLGQSIRQNTLGLALFAVMTAGLIAFTQLETKARITENVRLAKSQALHEIITLDMHDNELLDDTVKVEDPRLVLDEGPQDAYIARNKEKAVAVILPTIAPDGYTGKIKSIVGLSADGTIIGVRVLEHQETPGLGDKIEIKKSNWIKQFNGKSLNSPVHEKWAVKKDGGYFDQMTGATVTPRAVVKSIHQALIYFEEKRAMLLTDKARNDSIPKVTSTQQGQQDEH